MINRTKKGLPSEELCKFPGIWYGCEKKQA